ncbi:ubiquitin-specific protease 15 [Wolffia australiana]
MLEPREADIPALFLFLVVLPIVAYVLLGKWNDAAKKHARISILARLAAEEALRAEAAAAAADVVVVAASSPCPSPPRVATGGGHLCAGCGGPATTRCSRCKSVRYCSGKCQILHWRQGHKQECQQQGRNSTNKPRNEALTSDISISSPDRDTSERNFDALRNTDVPSGLSDGGSDIVFSNTRNQTPKRVKFGKVNFIPSHETPKHQNGSFPAAASASSDSIPCPSSMEKLSSSLSDGESNVECWASNGKVEPDHANERTPTKLTKPPYTLEPSKYSTQKSALKGSRGSLHMGSSGDVASASKAEEVKTMSVKKSPKVGKPGDSVKRIKVLFPYEELVKYFQCEVNDVSPRGLLNCGNSCYANAVLQCLTSTKPLLIYLLRRMHSKNCTARDWCLMCELEQHVSMLRETGGPLSPSRLLSNMRNIGCRIGSGTQEDAHEFLRLLVTSMQSICLEGLGGEKEVDLGLQETTLIQQIFGGRIRSKVKCQRCHLESERYENIMDLTLEIHGWVESLEDALTQFTAVEDLDGENMYRCGRCQSYVKARKQLSLHEIPNILTIVLKRFQSGKYGKINKYVTFPELLDMIPFMTGSGDSPPLYILYAVVVHLDTCNASFSGHYISYVKDLHGSWFKIDDSDVQAVSSSQVMSEGAYMLFYTRSFPRPPSCSSAAAAPRRNGSERMAAEFSDATSSSDWSLFTSSDDASFTTDSASDSLSLADQAEPSVMDSAAAIFSPFYGSGGLAPARLVAAGQTQTRFFRETRGLVLDSAVGGGSDSGNCAAYAWCGSGSGEAKRHRLVGSG